MSRSGTADETYFSLESFSLPKSWRKGFAALSPIDLDRDEDPDFVLVEFPLPADPGPQGPGLFFALRNDGRGGFTDASSAVFSRDAATNVLTFLVADFNRDGRQDLFIPAFGNDRAPQLGEQNQIFIQTLKGRLANETTRRLPRIIDATWGATAGDIDGDDDLDIFVCGGSPWTGLGPYFLFNNGQANFVHKIDNLPSDLQPEQVNGNWIKCIDSSLLLDVDNDDDLDLVLGADVGWTGSSFPPRDWVLLNDGKGRFTYAPNESMPRRLGGEGSGTLQIMSADFNKDGWPDLMMRTDDYGEQGGKLQLLLNNCDGSFRDAKANITYRRRLAYWMRLAVDFNNDGWMDYFDCDETGPRLLMNRGNARFFEMRDVVLPIPTDRIVDMSYPCDLDKDGDIDIFGVSHPPNGIGYVFRQVKPYVLSTKVLFPALLQAPAKGATGVATSVVMRWTDQNKKPYADEANYQVRIKSEGGTYKYFNVKKGAAYLKLSGLAAGTTYSWNIKAIGSEKDIKDSDWAVSGNDWKFTTK